MFEKLMNDNQKANLISATKLLVIHNYEDFVRLGKVSWDIVEPLLNEAYSKLKEEAAACHEARMNFYNENGCCGCCKQNSFEEDVDYSETYVDEDEEDNLD